MVSTPVPHIFRWFAIFSLPLVLLGCPQNNLQSETGRDDLATLNEATSDESSTLGDLEPTLFAPGANPNLIVAQVVDLATSKAVVTGWEGAVSVRDGVNEVCAINLTKDPQGDVRFCTSPQDDGSFVLPISPAHQGDHLSIFTNGPRYQRGGIGINDIQEVLITFINTWDHPLLARTTSKHLLTGGSYGVFIYPLSDEREPIPEHLKHFSVSNGLPSNMVTEIFVADDDHIWIGTSNGPALIQQLEPEQFFVQTFDHLPNFSNSMVLPTAIDDDRSGGAWIGSEDGLRHIKLESNQTFSIEFTPFEFGVRALAVEPGVGVWINTLQTLFLFPTHLNAPQSFTLSPISFRSLTFDENGDLWGSTDHEIFHFPLSHERNPENLIPNWIAEGGQGPLYEIHFDEHQTLWATAGNQVGYFDHIPGSAGLIFTPVFNDMTVHFRSIQPEQNQTLWTTTDPTGPGLTKLSFLKEENRYGAKNFRDMDFDFDRLAQLSSRGEEGMWIIRKNGDIGWLRWNSESDLDWTIENVLENLDLEVRASYSPSPNELWLGTSRGLVRHSWDENGTKSRRIWPRNQEEYPEGAISLVPLDTGSLPNLLVTSVEPDGFGGLWVGTITGLSHVTQNHRGNYEFENYFTEDGLFSDGIQSLLMIEPGKIIVGSTSGVQLITHAGSGNVLFHDTIRMDLVDALCPDNAGGFWMASRVALTHIQVAPDHTLSRTHYETFSGDSISIKMISDRNGNAWLGRSDGLFHASLSGNTLQLSDLRNDLGLPSNRVVDLELDTFNRLWIAMDNGLAILPSR